jgi:hypothetical protein
VSENLIFPINYRSDTGYVERNYDDNDNDNNDSNLQSNSYLFACSLNSPRANYKMSMSERKYKVQKRGNL